MAAKIVYKDVIPDGKKDITDIETSELNTHIADIDILKTDSPQSIHYATLEHNQWRLDGTYKGLMLNDVGYWGIQVSNNTASDANMYEFETPITITRVFANKHTSVGLSFIFSEPDYCSYLNIQWYNDDEKVVDEYFHPDNYEYFCAHNVEIFNRVVITFYAMNKPNRFLKIYAIDDGVNRTFTDKDIYSLSIMCQMSLISDELFNHQADLSLHSTDDTEFIFQKRQPMMIYNDTEFIGKFYVENSERSGKNTYDISMCNYTGILESNKFYGGIYDKVPAIDIISDIFSNESIDVNVDEMTANTLLSGYLPIASKRESLAQVLFACGSVCDTSGTETFEIFKLKNTLDDVPKSRIKEGSSVKTSDKITKVVVTAHSYTVDEQITELYNGTLSAGINVIEFSRPVDIDTVDVRRAVLIECHHNYCVVEVTQDNSNVIVSGNCYKDSTHIKELIDPDVVLGTTENTYEVTDATLVSADNIDKVLENVYNYYKHNRTLEADMVFENEKLGDNITMYTDWQGSTVGRIEQMEYDVHNRKIGKVVQRLDG